MPADPSSSGTSRGRLLAAVAAVAIAASLWSLLRGSRPPEQGANRDLYAGVGGQAAEKTLSLVERGGSVLVIEPRLFGHAAPGMAAMIGAYESGLKKAGLSVAAREVVTLPGPADDRPPEPPWNVAAMREKHPDANAIASFAGPPAAPVARGERPPMLVFCPEPVDARALLRRGEADIVIAPHPAYGETADPTSGVYAIHMVGDPQ